MLQLWMCCVGFEDCIHSSFNLAVARCFHDSFLFVHACGSVAAVMDTAYVRLSVAAAAIRVKNS